MDSTIDPLENIAYFTEWGGKNWEKYVSMSVKDFIKVDLREKKTLEIGSRNGRMACLFALLGSSVTAVDRHPKFLPVARREAEKWGVSDRIEFIYDFSDVISTLPDNNYDILFTKSVLARIPGYEDILRKSKAKLKPGAKVVLIENSVGNIFFRSARFLLVLLRIRKRTAPNYFTDDHVKKIGALFDLYHVEKSAFNPVYLILAKNSTDS